ncbi:hypothetical protein GCM10027168_74050 [Streptomyces capparidis]
MATARSRSATARLRPPGPRRRPPGHGRTVGGVGGVAADGDSAVETDVGVLGARREAQLMRTSFRDFIRPPARCRSAGPGDPGPRRRDPATKDGEGPSRHRRFPRRP